MNGDVNKDLSVLGGNWLCGDSSCMMRLVYIKYGQARE